MNQIVKRAISENGWRQFRGTVTLEEGEAREMRFRRYLFHRNPHHRCDTCAKPLSMISGPRCADCINTTLKVTP